MSDPIVTFDEEAVRDELKELVRRTVEDTLNALLEEEAEALWMPSAMSAQRIAKRTAQAITNAGSPLRQVR